jgi:hypothetical protein
LVVPHATTSDLLAEKEKVCWPLSSIPMKFGFCKLNSFAMTSIW